MASEIAELEKLFRDEALTVPEAIECFDARFYNLKAPAKAAKPFGVFQVIPVPSNFGQARTSIQQVFLIDFKIHSALPLPVTVDSAVAAVNEHFNRARTFTTDNFRISIRHERPISLPLKGATADEQLIIRGITFKAWVSKK